MSELTFHKGLIQSFPSACLCCVRENTPAFLNLHGCPHLDFIESVGLVELDVVPSFVELNVIARNATQRCTSVSSIQTLRFSSPDVLVRNLSIYSRIALHLKAGEAFQNIKNLSINSILNN